MADYPKHFHDVKYSNEHRFQNMDICLPGRLEDAKDKSVWILFLHGGAWRDISQDKAEIRPALQQLLRRYEDDPTTSALRHVAGIASINYRLSGEPSDPSRSAIHPDHIKDVLLALRWLEKHYGVRSEWAYIAVGHSCGATMAFQIAMDRHWRSPIPCESSPDGSSEDEGHVVRPPVAVVGLEGIYDFPLLLQTHADIPAYERFIQDAFGKDEDIWAKASPVAGDYCNWWSKGGLVILGQSPEDELIDRPQVEAMVKTLENQGWKLSSETRAGHAGTVSGRDEKRIFVACLKGTHDEVWERGTELSRMIEFALRMFFGE